MQGLKKPTYIICSTQRSGSSMLCQLLRQTGLLGKPGETIVLSKLNKAANECESDDIAAVASSILSELATTNGITGAKLHYHQFSELVHDGRLSGYFAQTKWLLMNRRDIVAQAVSLSKAWQTRQFSSKHESTVSSPSYKYESIARAGQMLAEEKASWEWFFARCRISPLRLFHEDVIEDENREVGRVFRFFGLESQKSVSLDRISYQKQGDTQNVEWISRFNRESELNFFNR